MIEQEMYQELTGRDRGMKNTYLTLNRFSRFYLLEMFTCDGTGWINHQDGEVIGTGY
jgi:hypothetical protein